MIRVRVAVKSAKVDQQKPEMPITPVKEPHILLVEDDSEISSLILTFLRGNGMQVTTTDRASTIDDILQQNQIDLLLLDLSLPDADGLDVCKRMRTHSDLPIIMLTARSKDIDRIKGLEIGADDYLAKPFNPRELLARIRAVLRRGGIGAAGTKTVGELHFDGWRLDQNTRHLLNKSGSRIVLTGAEFDLLWVFCENTRKPLSRDDLLDLTQGRRANMYERSVDLLVSRLRQKIENNPKEPVYIRTIRSAGYQFTPEVTPK